MPLKLVEPIPGRTPYYWVRGTYLGCYVERSTKARKRKIAQQELKNIERDIELNAKDAGVKTFSSAALSYMQAGGERKFITPLLDHFGKAPLARIDQAAIDHAAEKLYPDSSPATRNRQVYTPISAILKHAGVDKKLKRPKGSRGGKRTAWLEEADAFRLLKAAEKVNAEFGIICTMMLYTGMRLSECLEMEMDRLQIDRSYAYVPDTKTGEPRAVFLPPIVVRKLKGHPRGLKRTGRLFRYHKGGRFYDFLEMAAERAKIELPPRTAFHIFRHTYGTWMRLFGKLDGIGLIRTGAWADLESVERYAHSVPSSEAMVAANLPIPKGW
jgi:integrase